VWPDVKLRPSRLIDHLAKQEFQVRLP
jgi:hypothetical protein